MMGYQHNDEMLEDIIVYVRILISLHEPDIVDIKAKKEELDILFKKIMSNQEDSDCLLALPNIKQSFQLSDLEYRILWIIMALQITPDLRGTYQKIFSTNRLQYVLAFALLQNVMSIYYTDINMALEDTNLWPLLSSVEEETCYPDEKVIVLQDYVLFYIISMKPMHTYGITMVDPLKISLLPIHKTIFQKIEDRKFCIIGKKGVGKHSIHYHICNTYHQDSMNIDSQLLTIDTIEYWSKRCIFHSRIFNQIICFENVDTSTKSNVVRVLGYLNRYSISYTILLIEDIELDLPVYTIPDFLTIEQLQLCFTTYLVSKEIQKEILRCHISIRDLLTLLNKRELLQVEDIIEYRNHTTFSNPYCTCINSDITLSNWVGSDIMKEKLSYLLYIIKHKEDLVLTMNAQIVNAISAIFYGPSGTGKTYGAKALAGELKQRLLVANLAKINDKYIGETEKHLEEIFYLAAKHHCILFFDEADVLFTKRTEVHQANDKYANVSTAYLLQKIENFDGIVLLATNLVSNFDDAFLRRITMIMKFETCDDKDREIMYQRLLQIESFDYEKLAKIYPFSLARIKQIVFMVKVMASKENKEIDMELIKKAMQWELAKQGEILVERNC